MKRRILCVSSFLLLAAGLSCDNEVPWVNPCPEGMAFVGGGVFETGTDYAEMDLASMAWQLGFLPWKPQVVQVDSFCMDIYEYPNIAGTLPVASITHRAATQVCESLSKRLCTELEFERACGGFEAWHWPYGEDYQPGSCNNEAVDDVGNAERWLAPSGSFSDCVSPEGIYDLSGNLSEWVADDDARILSDSNLGSGDADRRSLQERPEAVVRGGTMWVGIYGKGCQARHLHVANGPTSPDDGFRCCIDVPISPTERSGEPKSEGL